MIGTSHGLDSCFDSLPAVVVGALKAAHSLSLEWWDPAEKFLDSTRNRLPGGSLRALLLEHGASELLSLLEERLNGANIGWEAIEPLKPGAVALGATTLGLKPKTRGLDVILAERAIAASKPVRGLERSDDRSDLIDSMGVVMQLDFLANWLSAGELSQELASAFRAGDESALDRALPRIPPETPAEVKRFFAITVTGRNQLLAERIFAALGDGRRHLFAIGAMHVVGPDSVVSQLTARGVSVKRVDVSSSVTRKTSASRPSAPRVRRAPKG